MLSSLKYYRWKYCCNSQHLLTHLSPNSLMIQLAAGERMVWCPLFHLFLPDFPSLSKDGHLSKWWSILPSFEMNPFVWFFLGWSLKICKEPIFILQRTLIHPLGYFYLLQFLQYTCLFGWIYHSRQKKLFTSEMSLIFFFYGESVISKSRAVFTDIESCQRAILLHNKQTYLFWCGHSATRL